MSRATVADQLREARALLVSLEADTPTLERNAAEQVTELERLRRAARDGEAEFGDVVAQQTKRDAAQGMLQQHLEDVAAARALVEELESASAEALQVAQVRLAWGVIEDNVHEYAALSQELEGQIKTGLDRLAELRAAHQQAQQEISRAMQAAAVRSSGLTRQQVADMLSGARARPSGDEYRRQDALISTGLEQFAALADPEQALELVAIARDVAGAGQFGPGAYSRNLTPTGCPLVSQALEVHRGMS